MPRLEYFLVAESYSADKDHDTVSIFNVFNEISADQFPFVVSKLVAVSCWLSQPEEIREQQDQHILVKIHEPGDHEPREFRGHFESVTKYQHFVLEVRGMLIREPGEVVVELRCNDQREATHTITVNPAEA